MSKIVLTADEIVSYLSKSSLINVLVEGPDDLMIYNWIENKIGKLDVKFLPCGGRSTMFEVFDRRLEFANKKVAYVADKDMYLFSGIPSNYSEIIFTSGYSIENDLYAFGKEMIHNLLTEDERIAFNEIINNLLPWYCSEIAKYLEGDEFHISFHLNRIIPESSRNLCPIYMDSIRTMPFDDALMDDIKANNFLKLRGKFIFDSIVRQLSAKHRKSKYSRDNALEICLKFVENTHFDRIIHDISRRTA